MGETPPLNITDTGPAEKPVLVFIHGFPFNQSMWKAQVLLAQPRFRVITYDQRGHGQSPVGDGQFSFEQFIDDLLEILDKKQISKAFLAGLSMGGYVALRTAERAPERIAGLVLADTRSEADSDEAKLKRAANVKVIKEKGLSVFCESFLKGVLAPETSAQKPEIVEQVRGMIMGNNPLGVSGTLLAMAGRTDTTASLGKIQVPTLILVGEKDGITPPQAAQNLNQKIPDSRLAVIPQAGHMSNLENPEVFNRHLGEFLTIISK